MSNSLTTDITEILKPSINGITLIITIGNTLRCDDGVGPYIADNVNLSGKHIVVLNAGDKPERIIDKAIEYNPEKTVIIDAGDFGGAPGDIKNIDKEQINNIIFSTHTFPLSVIAKIVEEETKKKVYFIGIQSEKTGFGEGLSRRVKETADKVIDFLNCLGEANA